MLGSWLPVMRWKDIVAFQMGWLAVRPIEASSCRGKRHGHSCSEGGAEDRVERGLSVRTLARLSQIQDLTPIPVCDLPAR